MIVVRWLWRLSVATALALLGPSITSAAVLAAPPEATQTYTYDSPQHPAGLADIAIERGPPPSHARDIRYDAVDQWSHGDSVRPDSPVAGSTTTDAIPAEFAQDNSVTTGAGGHAAVVDGDFPSLHRARVAAKSVDELAEIGFRSDTSHIFRNATGHLAEDTAENRALIKSALDPANLRDTITLKDGTTLQKYFRDLPDGSQAWAEVRNGEITNGGLNVIPR